MFSAPLFLSYGAGQLNSLLEKYIASLIGVGVISSINYAVQIKGSFQAIITSVMFTLVVPSLTRASAKIDGAEFFVLLKEALTLALIFLLFVIPILFGTADALAETIIGSSQTTLEDVIDLAWLIRLYGAALLPVVLFVVFGVALLAQQKSGPYALLGIGAQVFSAILLIGTFGAIGKAAFPIALFVSHMIAALFMLRAINTQQRGMLIARAGAMTALVAFMAVLMEILNGFLSNFFDSSWTGAILAAAIFILGFGFLGACANAPRLVSIAKAWLRR